MHDNIGFENIDELRKLSFPEIADQLVKTLSTRFPGAVTSDISDLKKQLSDELAESPFREITQKFEYFYLSYRVPSHFNTFGSNFGEFALLPVLDKNLLKVFYGESSLMKKFNVGPHIVNELNPILNMFGYDNTSYNLVLENEFPGISKGVTFDDVREQYLKVDSDPAREFDYSEFDNLIEENFVKNLFIAAKIEPALNSTLKQVYIWHKNCNSKGKNTMRYMSSRIQMLVDILSYTRE